MPQRLTGIWMGNADNSEMHGISSAIGPGVLWRDYMKTVVGGLPPVWYQRPSNVINVTVCVNPALMGGNGSGLLPGPQCPSSFRKSEVFVQGTEPKTDDRSVYVNGCYRLIAHFPDWQPYANTWAANAGKLSGGRFGGVCGTGGPMASGSPSASPSGAAPSPSAVPKPTTTTTPPPGQRTATPVPQPTLTLPPFPITPTPPPPTKKP
jgi:membrane peptidoglycan carboxypeptidase